MAGFRSMLRQVVAWLIAALLLAPVLALAAAEKKIPASLEELQTLVAGVLEVHDVPAVGIAMVDREGPIWVGSLGVADRERNIAADADTLYRIGSTSKMFVALSVLKLVEQGRLSLDDRGAWSLQLDNGTQVYLGRDSMEERLQRLLSSWDALMEEQEVPPRDIDLRYTNGFAVAWAQETEEERG